MPEKKIPKFFFSRRFFFVADRPTRFLDRPATRNKLFPKDALIPPKMLKNEPWACLRDFTVCYACFQNINNKLTVQINGCLRQSILRIKIVKPSPRENECMKKRYLSLDVKH